MESDSLCRGPARKYFAMPFGNLATQAADRWLARLGEFPPGSVVKRVGDRHAPVGSLAGGHRLPIGMIAPDEVAPAGRQLIERQRRTEAEFRRDLGRCLAGAPGRVAGRSLGGR